MTQLDDKQVEANIRQVEANIAQSQASSIRLLTDGGYDPQSVIRAVTANDLALLLKPTGAA